MSVCQYCPHSSQQKRTMWLLCRSLVCFEWNTGDAVQNTHPWAVRRRVSHLALTNSLHLCLACRWLSWRYGMSTELCSGGNRMIANSISLINLVILFGDKSRLLYATYWWRGHLCCHLVDIPLDEKFNNCIIGPLETSCSSFFCTCLKLLAA